MNNKLLLVGPHKDFESIKKVDENGIEFWEARELMPLLGYDKWERAQDVVDRAIRACQNSGQDVKHHFPASGKMIDIGHGALREVKDYKLDRYACYLIAQNGDPRKTEIDQEQTYFAIQARKQEIFQGLSANEKRLAVRGEVSVSNRSLFKAAKGAGVNNFGLFNDAGYKGLYGMPLSDIEQKKGIKKGELLDRAGSTELAANLFRITQTEDKLKRENIQGQQAASQTHFVVGKKVRKTIEEIGGMLPEN
jgi:DNA-damage-inducible protein D